MQRRRIIPLLVTVVLAAVGLLAYTEAMAQCPIQNECTFVDASGTPSPWHLKLFGSNEPADGKYKWTYRLTTQNPSGISQVVTLVPVCCPELGYSILGGGQVQDPGKGDPTTNFGAGVYQERAIRMDNNAQSNPYDYVFYTASRATELSNTTMQLKAGNKIYYCRSIAGPDCSIGSPYSPNMKLEEFSVQNVRIRIEWDENSPSCDAIVSYSTDGVNYTTADLVDVKVNNEPLVECGPVEGNQKCQRCRFTTAGSTYTYIKIGGVTYKVCVSGC